MSEAIPTLSNVIEFPGWRATTDPSSELEVHRAVSEERRRIARELHDVVASSFATITVQTGVATQQLDCHPEQAAEALMAIKSASKQALGELRVILGLLRGGDDVDSGHGAPGLGRVEELAENATAAGVPTQARVLGRPRPLPTAVDLAAFRIVQESLANVVRHAGRSSALIMISYERERLVVEVADDGNGVAADRRCASEGSGYGIAGMRERVHALGGELEAGPRVQGGFRVCARLPVLGRP
jgi:signal transduction histidine kinase